MFTHNGRHLEGIVVFEEIWIGNLLGDPLAFVLGIVDERRGPFAFECGVVNHRR